MASSLIDLPGANRHGSPEGVSHREVANQTAPSGFVAWGLRLKRTMAKPKKQKTP